MPSFPDTRLSLVLRLPTRRSGCFDEAAWNEFASAYAPFLRQFAIGRGLQPADADEIVQRVLMSVAESIDRWKPGEGNRTGFRNWLFTIARNQTINLLKKQNRTAALGGSSQWQLIQQAAADQDEPPIDQQYRQETFRWAAAVVRSESEPSTWSAFERTMIKGQSCREAAEALGLSIGNVYVARSRILSRIKSKVAVFSGTCPRARIPESTSASESVSTVDRSGQS